MSRYSRDGAKVNRLFTLATIVIMSAVISLYVNYIAPAQTDSKKKVKNSGLPCQQDVVCFDKVYDKKLIKEAVFLLNKGNFILSGELEYSSYMQSVLKQMNLDIKEFDSEFKKEIQTAINHNMQKYVRINYEIIENDKKHPNKKNSKSKHCKLYAGYLLTSFKMNGRQIFRMQIDFNNYDIDEIKKRIKCSIKAFRSHG